MKMSIVPQSALTLILLIAVDSVHQIAGQGVGGCGNRNHQFGWEPSSFWTANLCGRWMHYCARYICCSDRGSRNQTCAMVANRLRPESTTCFCVDGRHRYVPYRYNPQMNDWAIMARLP